VKTAIRNDRRTTAQLLSAAAKDTDAASVFYTGTSAADYDGAIIVIKGREHAAYLIDVLVRQKLVTPGKPVEGAA
jgi:hypothetical protein